MCACARKRTRVFAFSIIINFCLVYACVTLDQLLSGMGAAASSEAALRSALVTAIHPPPDGKR